VEVSETGRRTRILFVHPSRSPFIEEDRRLLSEEYDLRVVDFDVGRSDVVGILRLAWRMFRGVIWADLTYSWFAERHALLAVRLSRLFGKPSIVVVGGYEVAKVPEIEYGSLLDRRKERVVRKIHERADRVLPVDGSLKRFAVENLGVDGRNIEPVPTGYDPLRFAPKGPRTDTVLTAGNLDRSVIRRKGLDTFVEAAKLLPGLRFVLVGRTVDEDGERLKRDAPPNVVFTGPLSHEELIARYQSSKVYCQLSRFEGLPNALCEAMLCGCVPVGTEHCGIPTAMGDTGFYVPYGDAKATAEAIEKAVSSGNGDLARARIMKEFTVEKRADALRGIIDKLLD
jgi:glycosyltransferase involved in cell wall biosynthesis